MNECGTTLSTDQLINVDPIRQTAEPQFPESDNVPIATTADELESILQKALAAHAGLSVSKRHLLQLPEELLTKISHNVRGDFNFQSKSYSIAGIGSIKNLRLTCRRLCDTSSPLLVHRLNVGFTRSSLDHLSTVSRHPTISKGIRSLRVCLRLRRQLPAEHLKEFAGRVVHLMRRDQDQDFSHLRSYAAEIRNKSNQAQSTVHGPNHALHIAGDTGELSELMDDLRIRDEVIQSATRIESFGYGPYFRDDNARILFKTYELYRQLVQDQDELLQNDTFVQIVTEAVARMPSVAQLSITDGAGLRKGPVWPNELSHPIFASVRKRILRASSWSSFGHWILPLKPVELIPQLPIAFIRAGKPLNDLRIRLDRTAYHKLRLSEELCKDVASAAENLEVLEVACCMSPRAFQTDVQATVCRLVSLLLKGKNLRSVALRFGSTDQSLSLAPLLALLPWANLNRISLVDGSFEYDELSQHLEKLKPGTYIFLQNVRLSSGLWVDLFDVIRAKGDRHSEVISPRGGGVELEDSYEEYSDEEDSDEEDSGQEDSDEEDMYLDHS